MSCPEPQPIEKLMMKITTKAHLYSSAQTKADSEQNDENIFVSQHSSKPNVGGSCFHFEVVICFFFDDTLRLFCFAIFGFYSRMC
jgi:hypothetical protein